MPIEYTDDRIPLNGSFFSGVTVRVFPLRADPSILQDFVDRKLNRDETSSGNNYFRSANSYVYLQVLNYDKISARALQMGYSRQNEVLFSIPLLWYKKNPTGPSRYNGERWELVKFQNVATSPYIFVDNEISVLSGRELYGWPKLLMKLDSKNDSWLKDPTSPDVLLKAKVSLFEQLFQRQRRKYQPLLEIRRRNPIEEQQNSARRIEERVGRPVENLTAWSEVAKHKQMHDAYWAKEVARQAHPLEPNLAAQQTMNAWSEVHSYEQWQASAPMLGRLTNNIGFREFLLSDQPIVPAYSALCNSISRIDHIRAIGPLGEDPNDLSSGYTVSLRNYDQLPIADELGLISSFSDNKKRVFKPISPSWFDVDLGYEFPEDNQFLVFVHDNVVQQDLSNLPRLRNEFTIGRGYRRVAP